MGDFDAKLRPALEALLEPGEDARGDLRRLTAEEHVQGRIGRPGRDRRAA